MSTQQAEETSPAQAQLAVLPNPAVWPSFVQWGNPNELEKGFQTVSYINNPRYHIQQ